MAVGASGTILIGNSAGTSWSPRDSGTPLGLRAIPMFNSAQLVVGEQGLVLRSTNLGAAWFTVPSGTLQDLNAVEYSSNNTSRVYAVGDGGTILRSTDAGSSWVHQQSGVTWNLNSVFFYLNDAVGYAAGDHGVILSTLDGGSGPSAVDSPAERAGSGLDFAGVVPNPLTRDGVIRFRLREPRRLSLRLFDVRGEEIGALLNGEFAAGSHDLHFSPARLPRGVFYLRAESDGAACSRRFVVLR